jgi:hypothetical protein
MMSSHVPRKRAKFTGRCAMRAALLALLAPMLLVFAPTEAQGGDSPPQIAIRLTYILGPGTKSSPPEQTLHDEVARRMGYDPFVPDAADRVVTTLRVSARSSTATVEFHDTGDHRWDDTTFTIPDNNCMALVTGAAIYISYMFAPFALPPSTAAPPAPPAPAPPAPAPSPPAAAPPPSSAPPPKVEAPPPPPRSEPLRLNLGIAGALALRTAPAPFAFNLMVGAGLRYKSFSGALEFRWTPPEVAAVDLSGRELVRVKQYAGGLLPCGHYRALFYCGVVQVSAVHAAVTGKVTPDDISHSSPSINVSAATGARFGADLLPVWQHRFALRLSADLLLTVRDVTIRLYDAPTMGPNTAPAGWTTPRMVVALGVGIVTDLSLKFEQIGSY